MITDLSASELTVRYPILAPVEKPLIDAINALIACFDNGNKLLICGNGGSASDSDHICGELNKGFLENRPLSSDSRAKFAAEDQHIAEKLQNGLPCINLTNSAALISAYGNDVDWRYAYAQQAWALGRTGDILLGISTSGNSKNVVLAAKTANAKGMRTIALTGSGKSQLSATADFAIMAPSTTVHHIQELHLPIYHAICIELETHFFKPAI